MSLFLVPASQKISFSLDDGSFMDEYIKLSSDGEGFNLIRGLRAKRDLSQNESIIINLLLSLHKKIDAIDEKLGATKKDRLTLLYENVLIESIGFEHILLRDAILEPSKRYYARAVLSLYPNKEIAFFMMALDGNLAKIEQISDINESEWSNFVSATEREYIRATKGASE